VSLTLVAASALTPGSDAEVVTANGDDGSATVRSTSGEHTLPAAVARHLWVVPA